MASSMRAVVQLQPSPCSIYSRDMSAIGCASAGVASRMPGRNITAGASRRHSFAGLVDDIDLRRRLDHLPGADETPGNDHAVARRQRGRIAGGVDDDAAPLQNLAILLLGIGDAPLADLAAPDAGEEFSTGVDIVLPDALPGIASDQLVARQKIFLDHCLRGLEFQ